VFKIAESRWQNGEHSASRRTQRLNDNRFTHSRCCAATIIVAVICQSRSVPNQTQRTASFREQPAPLQRPEVQTVTARCAGRCRRLLTLRDC
jgi:hypothetical protein